MFEEVTVSDGRQADAVVLAIFDDRAVASDPGAGQSLFEQTAVKQALARREITGEIGSIVETFVEEEGKPVRIFLLGLGARGKFGTEAMRKAAAALGRRVAKSKDESLRIDLASTLRNSGTASLDLYGRCIGEVLGLLSWKGKLYGGSGARKEDRLPLRLSSPDPELRTGLERGVKLARSANFARNLSQTPPNIATPLWMADQARKLAEETGLSCRVIDGEELAALNLQGLINVGRASVNPPCMIRLEYRPESYGNGDGSVMGPVVLLGKTITYDTGGLTLKISNGMVGMKRDKDGGCAVLGAMHAVATLIRPARPVVGLLVAAENSVSDSSMRPDDVITYRNGVTVEVTNTDAEGRLVLADGLCWACEEEGADCIVDLATLTGGVVTALGSTYAGLFCEDDGLRTLLDRAAQQSGERLWRLPLHDEYREMLKSPVADIINSNPNRKAHPIQGAAFLSHFVKEGTPWAHIDIAGVHAVDTDTGPFIKGPTGFGVRLLAEMVADLANRPLSRQETPAGTTN